MPPLLMSSIEGERGAERARPSLPHGVAVESGDAGIQGAEGQVRRGLVFFEYALFCWVGWLLLVQSVEPAELVTGAVAALLAAAVAVGGCDSAGAVGVGPVLAWSRRAPRLPWRISKGTARVFGTLRHPRRLHLHGVGRMTALPLPDSGTDPLAIARRALAIWEGSLSPDEYVVCVEREGGRMVVHQLPPEPGVGGGARRAPGGGARLAPDGGRYEYGDGRNGFGGRRSEAGHGYEGGHGRKGGNWYEGGRGRKGANGHEGRHEGERGPPGRDRGRDRDRGRGSGEVTGEGDRS